MTTGSCVVTGGCVESPHYGGGNYDNNEACTITFQQGGPIKFDGFNTELSYDKLTIGGAAYSGSTAPTEIVVQNGAAATWHSDTSVTQSGWRMCMASGT